MKSNLYCVRFENLHSGGYGNLCLLGVTLQNFGGNCCLHLQNRGRNFGGNCCLHLQNRGRVSHVGKAVIDLGREGCRLQPITFTLYLSSYLQVQCFSVRQVPIGLLLAPVLVASSLYHLLLFLHGIPLYPKGWSEMSLNTYQTRRRHIPIDSILHTLY
jgi:hypothetical protein